MTRYLTRALLLSLLLAGLPGCTSNAPRTDALDDVEATSLLGEPLRRSPISDASRQKLEADLSEARTAFERDPANEMAAIWYGRRLAYLGRYRDAIGVYTEALERHPDSYKLLRHRGHRWITVRQFQRAVEDLSRAALLIDDVQDEVEPDGMPNARNIPRSTTNSNIYYHLGLAHYLLGEYTEAEAAYQNGMNFATVNDDMLVAMSYWLTLTRLRLGDVGAAQLAMRPIGPSMEVIENHDYHQLLLLFRGDQKLHQLLPREGHSDLASATLGYGTACYLLISGDDEGAMAGFESVRQGSMWAAFGYIASEAELAR